MTSQNRRTNRDHGLYDHGFIVRQANANGSLASACQFTCRLCRISELLSAVGIAYPN
ncbi:hypothetical protein ACMFWY_14665 [Roseiconus sp. JC912]|uniref:hypothetical protein n=1 Tax=Roseiconus sp. JC912 TaxID=3396307 RepID=UPI003A4C83B4